MRTTLDDILIAIDTLPRRNFDEAYSAVVERFGKINGWEPTKDKFGLGHIGLDRVPRRRPRHSGYAGPTGALRYRDRTGHFAAIVMDQRDQRDPLRAEELQRFERLAQEYGVTKHIPPVPLTGFWWPTRELFVCFTRHGVVINWLPEQIVPSALFQETIAKEAQRGMTRDYSLTLVNMNFEGSYHQATLVESTSTLERANS